MERRHLGELEVSAIGLGCMSMTPFYGNPDRQEAIDTIRRAAELGVSLVDTADAYGAGRNEELVSEAIDGQRDCYVIATKFGNLRLPDGTPAVNGRPEYVQSACESSLRRLRIDQIDLYYQHRVDPSVPIEDTVGAMAKLVEQGKVRHIGLSEAAVSTIRRAHVVHPITALQYEYSLWSRDVEKDILPLCAELNIGFVAYSPLGRGFLADGLPAGGRLPEGDMRSAMPRFQGENLEANMRLVAELRRIAVREGATPAQVAIAWLLSRDPKVVPIAGASKRKWVEQNSSAEDLMLSTNSFDELDSIFAPGVAEGERLPESLLSRVGL